ncbi:hypothetical protein Fmac_018454 [Flemingia macrophylla]|uniref:Uncharacterized protein n=1 Tax=Flemingia macrophylla TaxID=520843 RepID=A0ABD1M5P1_9FABA
MALSLMSVFLNCFTASSSSQVSDYGEESKRKSASSEKPKSKGAPLVVNYFPVNNHPSLLK